MAAPPESLDLGRWAISIAVPALAGLFGVRIGFRFGIAPRTNGATAIVSHKAAVGVYQLRGAAVAVRVGTC